VGLRRAALAALDVGLAGPTQFVSKMRRERVHLALLSLLE
jgi:hypothetical protein